MRKLSILLPLLMACFLAVYGCVTSRGGAGVGVLVGKPSTESSPQAVPPPPKSKGQETAGRNSLRNAYRFLEKGMPDQAIKELHKAEDRLSADYWYNYYLGGAYYMKGQYQEADARWELAFRFAVGDGLRSRVRTCQSYLSFALGQEGRSRDMLEAAIGLDSGNSTARSLLQDLGEGQEPEKGGQKPDKKTKTDKKAPGRSGDKGKARKLGSSDSFNAFFMVQVPE